MQEHEHDHEIAHDGLWRRLRHTPLTDTLRGRVTGSLDREAIIARSGIPPALATLVRETVRSTGLHRDEKAEVARDLAEHFRDGIDRGESPERLEEDFGDPAAAAALIRRSMMRKRSWWSRQAGLGVKVSAAALVLLISIYLVVAFNDWRQSPNIAVDHLAAMNAPIAATPVSERAWPLIREGLTMSRGLVDPEPHLEIGVPAAETRRGIHAELVTHAREGLPHWYDGPGNDRDSGSRLSPEEIEAFFAGHEEARRTLLAAATRRNLGFEIMPGGPEDPLDRAFLDLGPSVPASADGPGAVPVDPFEGSLINASLPHLGSVRAAARLLDADARKALIEGDAARAIEDFEAMFELGRMVREPSIILNQLVGAAIDQLVFQSILDGIATMPGSFTDADLRSAVAMLEGLDESRFVIDLEGERLLFEDLAQRIYTDDGDGDGRLTMRGMQGVNGIGTGGGTGGPSVLQFLATPMFSRVMLSRAEALRLWNEIFDAYEVAAGAPAWEIDRESISSIDGRNLDDLGSSSLSSMRYFPLTLLVPAIDNAILMGHVGRADRDLATAVVGVEAARRRLGGWPTSLEEAELARLPIDPVDGRRLAYGIIEGRPSFWSIGPDRDEDGGTAITTTSKDLAGWGPRRNEAGFGSLTGFLGAGIPPEDGYDGDVVVWRGGDGEVSPR